MDRPATLSARIEELLAAGAQPSGLVDAVLEFALEAGASDAHFEPLDAGLAVRLRLDGVLAEAGRFPGELAGPLIARLKVLAGLATYRTDVPQDGRIPREGSDLRLSTYPTVRGEKAVVRLFARRAEDFRLELLGLPDGVLAALRTALAAREGLILFTGPAGSGKTTTIYAALQHLRDAAGATRQIVSIEDPVECLLPGVTQTEVNPPAGLTFANCLRSVLRQDPEVIAVGEVRDRETAELAAEAALTGHLVIATLHAGTAPGVFARLVEMGLEPATVTSVVRLAVAQRLVRRTCAGCAGRGCPECAGSGHRGRLPIAEALPLAPEVRRAVLERVDLAGLRAAAASAGMVGLGRSGAALVESGATSLPEVERVLAGLED
jgi:type II secretory ATPase GspE/PulE/Tfp pilus assembly ATPase PilB-like protein